MIAATRRKSMFEIEKNIANFWLQSITAINPRKPDKMFSEINKIFRSKKTQNSSELKLEASRESLLVEAGIDVQLLKKDVNDCSIIREDNAKADLLAAYYSLVNNQNKCINNSTFRSMIDNKVNLLLHDIALTHHNAICNFSEINNALKPSQPPSCANYFTSVEKVRAKFKNLNNKKSAGNDQIPKFIPKQLPANIVRAFAILFDNLLN
ncbi:hypothetical protein M0802_014196 [Mischocyttarus mexicanus]|nr:hypothetical protein M0802_014196 [Mischocyttarus mexicanus]